VQALAAVLNERWGILDAQLRRAQRGHTNQTFFVDAAAGRFVLRRSWPGKPEAQVTREERVLEHLARAAPELPVARLVPTREGAPRARHQGRWLHLYTRLVGEPCVSWRAPCSPARARSALALLGRLHGALASLPCADADPLAPLGRRLSVAAGTPLHHRVHALIDEARAALGGPAVWVHGDFHLENLLFSGERASGLCDFDDVGPGACALDVAFALFAVSRDGHREDRFAFDRALFFAGLDAYRAAAPLSPVALEPLPLYERLFCAHQALIHLDAAARGLWRLGPGIGYAPCAQRLVDA
jgi:Ser/Thr protein kinase RdoA (MazF antagonist)